VHIVLARVVFPEPAVPAKQFITTVKMQNNFITILKLKNAIFWDVAPCSSCVNRRFGGMYRLHLQGRKIHEQGTSVSRWLQFLQNIGSHKNYTEPYPRKWHSS
jgi:hypothetical protein